MHLERLNRSKMLCRAELTSNVASARFFLAHRTWEVEATQIVKIGASFMRVAVFDVAEMFETPMRIWDLQNIP